MNQHDVLSCAFNAWYPTFAKYTIRSVFMDLPNEILDYIKNAPLVLPKNFQPLKSQKEDCSDSSDESWSSDSDTEDEGHCFPDFETKVNKIIDSLNGEVFPKLSWSAPKDASWINFGSCLKCTSAADLLVLLKASDFVSHDIYTPFSFCEIPENQQKSPLQLVLREWRNIPPESEFRCFIRSKRLCAICQRNYDSYFEFIENEKAAITRVISDFYETAVKDRFQLDNYVMDVYIGPNLKSPKCVKLVDFNVFGPPTDGLLFEWTFLKDLEPKEDIIFRCQTDKTMRSSVFSQYKLPIDLVDISTGNDPEKLIDLVEAHVEEQKNSACNNDK